MDRGVWWATVHDVAKSRTQLKWLYTCFKSVSWVFWSLCIFRSRVCPNCSCTQLFLVQYSFFVFTSIAAKGPRFQPVSWWISCLTLNYWPLTREREWDAQFWGPGRKRPQGALSHWPARDLSPNPSELEASPLQKAQLNPGAAHNLVLEPAQKSHRGCWNHRANPRKSRKQY